VVTRVPSGLTAATLRLSLSNTGGADCNSPQRVVPIALACQGTPHERLFHEAVASATVDL
jgi:hypothetical protein